jgi:hypothetical protein
MIVGNFLENLACLRQREHIPVPADSVYHAAEPPSLTSADDEVVGDLPKTTSQFTIRVSVEVCAVLPEVPVTVTV